MKRGVLGVLKVGLLSLLLLNSCSTTSYFKAECWQSALTACIIMQSNGYDCKIEIQKTSQSDKGIYHAQALAFDHEAGAWRHVVLDSFPVASWGNREYGEAVEYWDIDKTIDIVKQKVKK